LAPRNMATWAYVGKSVSQPLMHDTSSHCILHDDAKVLQDSLSSTVVLCRYAVMRCKHGHLNQNLPCIYVTVRCRCISAAWYARTRHSTPCPLGSHRSMRRDMSEPCRRLAAVLIWFVSYINKIPNTHLKPSSLNLV